MNKVLYFGYILSSLIENIIILSDYWDI